MVTKEIKIQALQQMIKARKINQMLYKYREIGDNTVKIFTDHTLWFEQPSKFNDPFDCWANVEEPGFVDIETLIDSNILSEDQVNMCKMGISSYTKETLKQDVDKVLNDLGVCCFSRTEKSLLMWSHYCKYHQGICLEFDILEDPTFFSVALPVDYVDTMPLYDHFKERKLLVEKLIQPKARCWEYEEEVRIIKTARDILKNGNNRAFKFNPKALKKVIFGCKTLENTIAEYKELCQQNGLSHVVFSKMYQKQNGQFGLEECPI